MQRARDLAYELLEEHGLLSQGWHAQLEQRGSTLGRCDPGRKTIYLSMHYIEHFSEQEVRQTLLDEIACALTGSRMPQDAIKGTPASFLGAGTESLLPLRPEK
jgi:hypothetical protein